MSPQEQEIEPQENPDQISDEDFYQTYEDLDEEGSDDLTPRRAKGASIFDEGEEGAFILSDDDDDDEGFKTQDDVSKQEKDFIKGSVDSSDPATLLSRKRTIKSGMLISLIIAAVIIVALIVFNIMESAKNDVNNTPVPVVPSPTATASGVVDDATLEAAVQPLLAIYPKAPVVLAGDATATLTEQNVVSSTGAVLQLLGSEMTPATTACNVSQPTDFCLAARGTNAETAYDVYYLKDAAHSRLFENPANFKQETIEGANAAGTLDLKMGETVATALALVNPDSSGWMIVFQSGTPEGIETVISATTLSTVA